SHWLYAGTGFRDGDSVPKLVGYEMDRYDSSFAGPTGATQWTFLSNSPYTGEFYGAEYAQSSIYQAPSGAWVFASGTMSWSWGLDNYWYTYADPRIQRTTAHLLTAFLNGAPKTVHDLKVTVAAAVGPANHLVLATTATPTAGAAFSFTVTAQDSAGNTDTGYAGTVHFTSTDTSTGTVLPANATLTNGQGTFSATLFVAGAQ